MRLKIQTRRATEADVPALIDLAQRAWLSGNCELAPIEAVRDWMAGDWESQRFPEIWPKVTVAEYQRRIIGLTSPDFPGCDSGQAPCPAGTVADLWVHPSYQRRGVGSALLDLCEREILANGYDAARLLYTEYNVAAPLFYLARGYREVSRSPDRLPSGVVRDVITMEKRLD